MIVACAKLIIKLAERGGTNDGKWRRILSDRVKNSAFFFFAIFFVGNLTNASWLMQEIKICFGPSHKPIS